jgi:hypothetical protein
MGDRGDMLRRAAEAERRLKEVRKRQLREEKAREAEAKLKAKAIADAKPECDHDNCHYVPKNYSDLRKHQKSAHPEDE